MEDLLVKLVVGLLTALVSAFIGLVVWLVKGREGWAKELADDRRAAAASTSELKVVLTDLGGQVKGLVDTVERLDGVLGEMGRAITTFGTETVRLSGRMDTMMERIADRPTRKEVTDEITTTRHTLRNELTEPFVSMQLRLDHLEKEKKP